MNTINSLSGGKTSSYLAVNYPADYEIFSVVCVDDIKCGHPDKLVMQYVNDKLSNYSQTFGEFMGTAENPIILKTMMDLEQKLGKEIIWVRGLSMDKIIAKKKMLPNQNNRFCTSETKMRPIFEWCYMHTELPVKMRVGFRWDESHRKDRFSLNFEYSLIANKGKVWRHKWIETDWRVGEFPLIDNKVHVQTIQSFWKDSDIIFPKDSNCQFCFWKDSQQILRNSLDCSAQINWAENIEIKHKNRFRYDLSINQIKRLPMQLDFFESDGIASSCKMGECLS
jgi:hypothetical protein